MKIDLVPKRPPVLDPATSGTGTRGPRDEMRRVFEICHNCRMCVGYCGTFPDVFGRVDRDIEQKGATGAEALDAATSPAHGALLAVQALLHQVPLHADEGHEWQVDVPRLLTREKAQRARRNGVTLQDRALGEPQILGTAHGGADGARSRTS
jgi:glycerol-3-phosphate dehydrogenase subunit C